MSYHVCYRWGRCWSCQEEVKPEQLGEWGAQVICGRCLHKEGRPCDGPFCSGDSDHKVCDCNAA